MLNRINTAFNRMVLVVTATLAAVVTHNPQQLAVKSPRLRTALGKGPTFIEYAMMALIVVVIGILIKGVLSGWFGQLFNSVSSNVNNFTTPSS